MNSENHKASAVAAPLDLKTDGHVHTRYCGHAVGEMEEYVVAAIAAGLKRIIFLEHLEVGIKYFESTWLSPADFERYRREGLALRQKYRDVIDIGLGLEVGYNPECLPQINQFIQQFPWDRVGISYHFYGYGGRHINLLSKKKANMVAFSSIGVAKVLSDYLQGLLAAVRSIPANVLCHLDAALRYHRKVQWQESHLLLIDQLLTEIADRGMALEVNTSGMPLRGEPFPPRAIINKAQALGIKLVAGSDAHRPQDVGRYFGQLNL